jgi:Piwi domain
MSTEQTTPAAAGRKSAAPRLTVNYLPVQFTADSFPAGLIRYGSADQLARLRAELSGTHVVVRTGDQIACVPLTAEAPAVGGQVVLDVDENLPLLIRLVEQSIIRMLLRHGYKLRKFAPPTFIARGPNRDLLAQAAQGLGHELAGVHVYPQYCLDARMRGPARSPGIVVGVRTRYEIDVPVSELLSRGVAVEGRYVLVADRSHDPRLDPGAARRAAGAVDAVDGDRLLLRDAPGIQEVAAADAWLEARRETMHEVVGSLTGPAAGTITSLLDQAVFGLTGAEGRLAKTTELAEWFGRNQLELSAGLAATTGTLTGLDGTSTRVVGRRIGEPVFVFDPAGDKTRRYADKGLDEFGPFDSEGFTPKRPSIVVVTPASFKGTVETFISSFLRGVHGGVFSQGFVRKYHLAGCDVRFEAFDSGPGDALAYREACLAALERPGKPDLAFVITSEEQEHLGGDDSPYLVAKSAFMGQGVPVQDVQIETIRKGNLAYPLNSIALACYAKLGGTPYVIAAPHALTQELVIGIGSAHVEQSRLTAPERVVGITTVFSADGNYLLSNRSREADYAAYPRELLRSLRECIADVKARNGWQPGDALRLIFHVFKPLKDAEAQAVKLLVERLAGEYASVEFAFVHVSSDHNWAIFDQASDGVPAGGRVRGRLVPGRGHTVPVSRSEMLLSVTGPRDMKLPLQGLPRPLLLKLHRESTFTDLEYLTGQLFRFTYLSWRRPYPSSHPVTILYSDLIAGLLGQLRHVKNWNADVVSSQLRESRWFL